MPIEPEHSHRRRRRRRSAARRGARAARAVLPTVPRAKPFATSRSCARTTSAGAAVALADAVLEDQTAVELGELARLDGAFASARRRPSSGRRPARRPRARARRSPGRHARARRHPRRARRLRRPARPPAASSSVSVSPVSVTAMGDSLAHVPARLTVVGSINLDLVARTERLPRPGETVTGATFAEIPGRQGREPGRRCRAARRDRGADRLRRRRRVRRARARRAARGRRRPRRAEDGDRRRRASR